MHHDTRLLALAGGCTGRRYIITNLVGILVATALNFAGSKWYAFSPGRLAFRGAKRLPQKP